MEKQCQQKEKYTIYKGQLKSILFCHFPWIVASCIVVCTYNQYEVGTKLRTTNQPTFFSFQELPKRISTEEEAEILSLLCKVHELEITKVEMQRDALLKEHEVRKRDLLILKYDKQRTLCDEIIERQRELIDGESEQYI